MKKITLLSLILMFIGFVNAQVFVENFATPPFTVDENVAGINNWVNSVNTSNAGTPLAIPTKIVAGALSYHNYPGSGIGNTAFLSVSDNASIYTTTNLIVMEDEALKVPEVGRAVYVAFLAKISGLSRTVTTEFFALQNASGKQMGKTMARGQNSGNSFGLGFSKNSNTGTTIASYKTYTNLDPANTYLFVIKYQVVEGASNDIVSLYVNPDPAKSEDEQTASEILTAVDAQTDFEIGASLRLAMIQRAIIANIGGIRAGYSWDDVVKTESPIIIPTTPLSSSDFHTYRGSFRNSATKFANQKNGRVAFMGGSITANAGWRDSISLYIRQKFPNTTFEFINAGISSMGSTPAAFRLERDVLSKGKVDLLFMEAAVNDGPSGNNFPKVEQIRAMEGIARHSLTVNPEMDIVFMYFADPSKNTSYNNNQIPDVIINHDSVAKAYNIPAINLAGEVAKRMQNKEFTWEADFKNLHPSPFGQWIYSRSMRVFLDKMWEAPVLPTDVMIAKQLPAEKIDANCYDSGYLVNVNTVPPATGWTYNPNWFPTDGVATRADYTNVPMLIGQTPDEILTFNFNGTAVGISPACGPNAGIIMTSIDGGEWKSTDLFTKNSKTLYLPWYYTLYAGLPEGDHTMRLKLSSSKNVNSTGTASIIRYFYVSGTQSTTSNPVVKNENQDNIVKVSKLSNGAILVQSNADNAFNYTVFDAMGKQCFSRNNCYEQDVFQLKSEGFYIIKTSINNQKYVNKILL
jgi:sialidase-1